MGLEKILCTHDFVVYGNKELFFSELKKDNELDEITLYMGTAGINKTTVCAIIKDKKLLNFAKIGHGNESKKLIQNETEIISKLPKLDTAIIPEIVSSSDSYIVTKNVRTKHSNYKENISVEHENYFNEILHINQNKSNIKYSKFFNNISKSIESIKLQTDVKDENLKILTDNVFKIFDQLDLDKEIICHFNHGDFTSWNCLVNNQERKLAIFDWELSGSDFPFLYDLFHFEFQKGIFLTNSNHTEILNNIIFSVNKNFELKKTIRENSIIIDDYIKYYTLCIASYSLSKYLSSEKFTAENLKQVLIWNKVLNSYKKSEQLGSNRLYFIDLLKSKLDNTTHAFLKFNTQSIYQLSEYSDLDILVIKDDIPKIIDFCRDHESTLKIKTVNKSFMTTVSIFFKDGSFLSLDLINKLKRKNLALQSTQLLLKTSTYNQYNVRVLNKKYDFEYAFLFYTLNKSEIPEKYQLFYSNYSKKDKSKIIDFINFKYHLNIHNFNSLVRDNLKYRKKVLKKVKSQNKKTFIKYLMHSFLYFGDTLKELKINRGITITFSGVDGAGKTTIINEIKKNLELKYRKRVILKRHRPGILPILSSLKYGSAKEAEKMAGINLPRQGNNRSKLSSYIRFGYYFIDYQIGQIYLFLRYNLRGITVIYDRYYYDFINDAKRTNLTISKKFTTRLFRFIFKPKLNFFLYADSEIIIQRKQELNKSEIDELSKNYIQLFKKFQQKYKSKTFFIINNLNLEKTLDKIDNEFVKAS